MHACICKMIFQQCMTYGQSYREWQYNVDCSLLSISLLPIQCDPLLNGLSTQQLLGELKVGPGHTVIQGKVTLGGGGGGKEGKRKSTTHVHVSARCLVAIHFSVDNGINCSIIQRAFRGFVELLQTMKIYSCRVTLFHMQTNVHYTVELLELTIYSWFK